MRDCPTAITFRRIDIVDEEWDRIVRQHPDGEVFHFSSWLRFLSRTQGVDVIRTEVLSGEGQLGYFVGAIFSRFGVRILGSPLRGWTTQCLGFLLDDDNRRPEALTALASYAFTELRCHHLEFHDRRFDAIDEVPSGFEAEISHSYLVSLEDGLEAAFGRMKKTTRNYVRQAQRQGLTTRVATDLPRFVDTYMSILTEVFARQGLAPTYRVERVRALLEGPGVEGHVIPIEVLSPSMDCIASAIYVAGPRTGVLWGVASSLAGREFHPNEVLHWTAFEELFRRGVTRVDLGGTGDYKAKFGGPLVPVMHLTCSRYRILGWMRSLVRMLHRTRQKVQHRGLLASLSDSIKTRVPWNDKRLGSPVD